MTSERNVVRLQVVPTGTMVTVNGFDISDVVTSVEFKHEAGEEPVVVVRLIPDSVDVVTSKLVVETAGDDDGE